MRTIVLTVLTFLPLAALAGERPRQLGINFGLFTPGTKNSITDVAGVRVGHATLVRPPSIRTGVTIVLPHEGNLFLQKVPAAVVVGNGFGKLIGSTQIEELGELESPIALTSTLNAPRVADALIDHMLALEGNEEVRSINVVVGETNDGALNDIRARAVGRAEVFSALRGAGETVEEGAVGAGAGTVAFGVKGGIGTSSRKLPVSLGGYTVGVLIQSNFGGVLTIGGVPVGKSLGSAPYASELATERGDGSIMIIVATDAPLDSRNLRRLGNRALFGLARTGAAGSNGSGDYVIAFSTNRQVRIAHAARGPRVTSVLSNDSMSPLFLAVIEATEEAIINSLFAAGTVTSNGRKVDGLPIARVLEILRNHGMLEVEGKP